jgi:hypothetical protein
VDTKRAANLNRDRDLTLLRDTAFGSRKHSV